MKAKKITLFLIVILIVCLTLSCVSCKEKKDETIELKLGTISKSLFLDYGITWSRVDNATYYLVDILAGSSYDSIKQDTVYQEENQLIYSYDFTAYISYNKLCITVTAFNDDGVKSNTSEYYWADKTKDDNEDPFIDGPNHSAGIVDGIDDTSYYYVKFSKSIYLLNTSKLDYAIVCNTVSPIKRIIALGIENSYEIDNERNLIIIKNSYISKYKEGAIIPIEIECEDNSKNSASLFIVDITPPALSTYNINFTYGITNKDKNQNILISNINMPGVRIQNITLDGQILSSNAYDITSTKLTLKASYFAYSKPGDHILKLYMKKDGKQIGYAIVNVTINNKDQAPINVLIDYDSSYPNVYVKWDSTMDYDEAIVNIGSTSYSSKSTEFSHLFTTNCFDATSKILNQGTEVYVTLVKDSINYTSYTITLNEDLSNSLVKLYLSQELSYLGNKFNLYIKNTKELDEFISYKINHYGDSDVFVNEVSTYKEIYTIYSPFLITQAKTLDSSKTLQANVSKLIEDSIKRYFDPLNGYVDKSLVEIVGNEITFTLWLKTGSNRPYIETIEFNDTKIFSEYKNSLLHYYVGDNTLSSIYKHESSSRNENFNNFKVDNIQKEAVVTTSSELLLALENGLKPVPVKDSNAEKIYNKAKEILRSIIDDRMTDYQKILAIYDWIAYNTIYDYGLANKMNDMLSKGKIDEYCTYFKHPSFFAEGVFDYGIAVCTGLSNAYSIMANIEGINCFRVTGQTSGGHAWIKVNIDGEWYLSDPTWANAKDLINNKHIEYITYDYFLFSSEGATGSADNRKENSNIKANDFFAGEDRHNFFASQTYIINGNIVDLVIENYNEFDFLISSITNYNNQEMLEVGDEIQFSINANYKEVESWLKTILSNSLISARYEVSSFARSTKSSSGKDTILNQYANTTYIRIKRVG